MNPTSPPPARHLFGLPRPAEPPIDHPVEPGATPGP